MFQSHFNVTAVYLIAWVLIGLGAIAPVQPVLAAEPAKPLQQESDAKPKEAPTPESGDPHATRLALRAHTEAGAFDKLPRFSYQARYRHGIVDSMRAVDPSIDLLKQGLTAPVLDQDWVGWYEIGFSWDEQRFLKELRPGEANLNYDARFWTASDAWTRHEAKNKSSIHFVRQTDPKNSWRGLHLFDFSYLRLTPHRYRWGATVQHAQTMSLVPPELVTWKDLGVETFGGETCDVVDSSQRALRLWIGHDTKRVRGALACFANVDPSQVKLFYTSEAVQRIAHKAFTSPREYIDWYNGEATDEQMIQISLVWNNLPATLEPNELVQFDDYREVSAGIWLPFRETRTFFPASETVAGKCLVRRSELVVDNIRTDLNLAERFAQLLPKEGDSIQDQRFAAPVNFKYRENISDEEIRQLADVEYQKRLTGQAIIKRLTTPIDNMVGKPAPVLPVEEWAGGPPPDVTGKPYLLRFWSISCGPCKNDLPRLKTLAERGVVILDMHPSETSVEEVEKIMGEDKFASPTYVATNKNSDFNNPKIGDYPAGIYPYYILIDAQGRVAGHGFLSNVLEKFGIDALLAPPTDPRTK